MSDHRRGPVQSLVIIGLIALVLVVALFARPLSDESTPWEFFREGISHTDSALKASGLIVFTIVLLWMNVMAVLAKIRLGKLLPILAVALAMVAVCNSKVRKARLVRVGFVLLGIGLAPLVIVGTFVSDNPVGLGLLFAFVTPIAALLIIGGTVLALTSKEPPSTADRIVD